MMQPRKSSYLEDVYRCALYQISHELGAGGACPAREPLESHMGAMHSTVPTLLGLAIAKRFSSGFFKAHFWTISAKFELHRVQNSVKLLSLKDHRSTARYIKEEA